MDLMDLENINILPLGNIKQETVDPGSGSSTTNAENACLSNSDNISNSNAGIGSDDAASTVCDSVEKQVKRQHSSS